MKLQWTLLSGAGNTFNIFFHPELKSSAELAKKVCQLEPADGVVFLKGHDNNYSWDFYNNDGSLAEMCGNATRCVGYYIEKILKEPAEKIKLKTTSGLIEINAAGRDQYKVHMTKAIINSHKDFFWCNTGVPHIVIEISLRENFEQHKEKCREIRKQNTNVTLLKKVSSDSVEAVSFERGVEDFTAACGTGAVAAALYMREKYKINQVKVQMPGGVISVDVSDLEYPIMMGAVTYVKDCVYDIEI